MSGEFRDGGSQVTTAGGCAMSAPQHWAVLRSGGWPTSIHPSRGEAERRAAAWNAKRVGAAPRHAVPVTFGDAPTPRAQDGPTQQKNGGPR
jgi:hypothetical protein